MLNLCNYSASEDTGATPSSVWYCQIAAQDLSSENVMTSMRVVYGVLELLLDGDRAVVTSSVVGREAVERMFG